VSRRTLSLLLAGVLAILLTAGASVARVPYVALGPGPMYDTLGEQEGTPVISIKGRRTYPTDGKLDLTTVGVRSDLTLAQALRGYFERDLAVVPRDVVYPPDQTREQVDEANAEAMRDSQSGAVVAAARTLGLPVARVFVESVPAGSPSTGLLEKGDRVVKVDGKAVRDLTDVLDAVRARRPGQRIAVTVERGGAQRTVDVVAGTAKNADGRTVTALGVGTRQESVKVPFDVTIGLQDVGGPSAGLMFTLGILDKLGPASLTGGKFIAGTGEIRSDASVAPIGGITQKLIAAERNGAVAFLVPADNCAEAVQRHPAGLPLIEVHDVDEALTGLEALRDSAPLSTCPGS